MYENRNRKVTISGNALKEGRLGKPQKNLFLMTVRLRGGGLPIKKEKNIFYDYF